MNTDFYRLGKLSGSDKIYHHGYHRFYASAIPRDTRRMLEIGIENGSSLQLWLDYLPEAFIYGMDINKEYSGDRHNVVRGDQSSVPDLIRMVSSVGGNSLEFILDDGSHVPEHQLLTFVHFFPQLLKAGGVYIIEDIETSYWVRNGLYGYATQYGVTHERNIVSIFQMLSHLINREFIGNREYVRGNLQRLVQICGGISVVSMDAMYQLVLDISTITFGQNCIIIKKKEEYEHEYDDRVYRFQENI